MNIRAIKNEDVEELRAIHTKFYNDEFEFPNFFDNYLSSFVVTDEDGRIITGGGVRTITESVIITDKDYPIRERRTALLEMLRASIFTASSGEFKQLHSFVQDDKWYKHLKRFGFKETKGKALVLNF